MRVEDHSTLHQLIEGYTRHSEDLQKDKEQQIWQAFGTTGAVLITDMSGFSAITKQHGIVYYLSLIMHMQQIVEDCIRHYDGILIKYVADDAFVLFPDSASALLAVRDIFTRLQALNDELTDCHDIKLAIGIAYGELLNFNNQEIFGDPVNEASKLGEDTASAWEILLTEKAYQNLPAELQQAKDQQDITIGKVTYPTYFL